MAFDSTPLRVEVVSAEGLIWEGDAVQVIARTTEGVCVREETSQAIASATSSGSVRRRVGVRSASARRIPSGMRSRARSVRVRPGSTALTRTPCGAYSADQEATAPSSPALIDPYTADPGMPSVATLEDTTTTRPFRSTNAGKARSTVARVPAKFVVTESAIEAPAYVVGDLMAEYTWRDLSVKASLLNVADTHFADFLYRGHYVPGRPRTVQVTFAYRF